MVKIYVSLFISCLWLSQLHAQGLYNNGANIVVESGATLYIDGDANGGFRNEGAGLIDIDGDIVVEGNWTNNASNNVFTNRDNDGWVRFKGTATETVGGSADTRFEYVDFNNSSAGTPISLSRNMIVEGICRFTDGVVVTGSNYLIIESTTGSDIVGYSNTSFVNGNLRRYIANNVETYPFPVGDGLTTSDYYLAELINDNLTGAGFNYIDAKFAPLANHSDGDLVAVEETTPYTSVGTEGVWFLDPDVAPSGGKYDLKLHTTNFSGLANNQFTVLSRPTGSVTAADWTCNPCGFGDPGINISGGAGRMVAGGYALRYGMSDFSQKAIGKTTNVLPIKLISFYAECEDEQVKISWVTTSESNNEFFTIEKSINGTEFTVVDIVQGAGTSNNILDYMTYDNDVSSLTTYYRLKQTDFDGRFTYSDLVITNCSEDEEEIGFAIMPNPATDYVNIVLRGTTEERAVLTLFDGSGKLVYSNELYGGDKRLLVHVGEFTPGIYYVRLISGNRIFTEKLIKI